MVGFIDRILARFADFNQANCNEQWRGLSLKTRVKPAILEGLLRLGRFMVGELFSGSTHPGRAEVLLFAGTANNLRSASLAGRHLPSSRIVTLHNLPKGEHGRIGLFSQYFTGLWALIILPLVLWREKKDFRRKAIFARLDNFVLTFGWGRGIRSYLQRTHCRCVVVTSNLSVYQNLIVEQARKLAIPTIFISHAPIGRGQGPLMTDHAFLDGEIQTRLFPQSATEFHVTGSARGAELVRNRVDRSSALGVLIATNSLVGDLGKIEAIVRDIRSHNGEIPIGIRPHPADRARFKAHQALCARLDCGYHDPSWPLFEHSEDYRFLLTGFSGVIVEALLLGFDPLELCLPELEAAKALAPADYYGLEELQLIRPLDLDHPKLPWDWHVNRAGLKELELSAEPDWDAGEELSRAIAKVLDAQI